MRKMVGLWSGMAIVALAVVMTGCRQLPDEQQIRQAVADGAKAAQSADAGHFGDFISQNFTGNDGVFDRRRLLGLLRLMRLRGEKLTVQVGLVSVQARGQRYVTTFTAVLAGTGRGLLPSHLSAYRVTAAWRKEHGQWRCYSAHWERHLRDRSD